MAVIDRQLPKEKVGLFSPCDRIALFIHRFGIFLLGIAPSFSTRKSSSQFYWTGKSIDFQIEFRKEKETCFLLESTVTIA